MLDDGVEADGGRFDGGGLYEQGIPLRWHRRQTGLAWSHWRLVSYYFLSHTLAMIQTYLDLLHLARQAS
jgi:hypothetical protein